MAPSRVVAEDVGTHRVHFALVLEVLLVFLVHVVLVPKHQIDAASNKKERNCNFFVIVCLSVCICVPRLLLLGHPLGLVPLVALHEDVNGLLHQVHVEVELSSLRSNTINLINTPNTGAAGKCFLVCVSLTSLYFLRCASRGPTTCTTSTARSPLRNLIDSSAAWGQKMDNNHQYCKIADF